MRAVDKTGLTKYVGTIHDETLTQVEKAIKLHLAID
jgi:mRNA-degrading endonuclease toxin of MazEF toxin-antitoxin module